MKKLLILILQHIFQDVCNKSELQKWFTSFCCDGDSFSLINNAGVAVNTAPSEERTYEEFSCF